MSGSQRKLEGRSSSGPASVLIVDDELVIREILMDFLAHEGYRVLTADSGHSALTILERDRVDLVLTDLCMPDMDGIELLSKIREYYPHVVTMIMTGHGSIETATRAMRLGAFDFVQKPFKVDEVILNVQRGLEQQRLRSENIELRGALSLYELVAHLSGGTELEPTLRLVAETIHDQTHADTVDLLIFPRDDEHFEGVSLGGTPLSESDLTDRARELTEAVLAEDARVFHFLKDSPRTHQVTSLLIMPMIQQDKRLGLVIATREGHSFLERDRKLLTIVVDRAAVAVQNAQLFELLERSFRHTVEALVTALEEKDRYTAGHSERVAMYARITAQELGLSKEQAELIYQAGRLHDIGKLTIRSDELNKPTSLTPEEVRRFKMHPVYGEELLGAIPTFKALLPGIGGHHENFDGTGYPRGLKGYDIPLMARIMAVADAYDAITSHRAYRSALPHSWAVTELRACAGTQFDPDIVEAFLKAIVKWRIERQEAGAEYPA